MEPETLNEKAVLERENIEDSSINTSEDSGVEAEALSNETETTIEEKSPTKPDANPESDEPKCDNCSTVDIENTTNSLANKVNIRSTDSCNDSTTEQTKCDMEDINTTNKENTADKAATSPQKRINKVHQLNIPETDQQDASCEKSAVIVKQQTESLNNLMAYSSSLCEDSEDDDDDEQEEKKERKGNSESENRSDSDDSDDTEDTLSSDDDDDDDDDDAGYYYTTSLYDFALKIYSENSLEDLPPIRDISRVDIDMEKEEFLHIGNVEAIIQTLITVGSLPEIPTFDLGTCFFIEDETLKRPLGAVYDVIGPAGSPLYCIRFQCPADIEKLNIKKGMKVFSAPKSKYTHYVFVKELMEYKGSHASWVDDVETPPDKATQLSDDEYDLESEVPRKPQKHSSPEHHKSFEENTNRSNTLNSHAFRVVEVLFNDNAQNRKIPAALDPTVPPPGFHSFPRFGSHGFKWLAPPSAFEAPRCYIFGQAKKYRMNNDTNQVQGTSTHPY